MPHFGFVFISVDLLTQGAQVPHHRPNELQPCRRRRGHQKTREKHEAGEAHLPTGPFGFWCPAAPPAGPGCSIPAFSSASLLRFSASVVWSSSLVAPLRFCWTPPHPPPLESGWGRRTGSLFGSLCPSVSWCPCLMFFLQMFVENFEKQTCPLKTSCLLFCSCSSWLIPSLGSVVHQTCSSVVFGSS